MYVDSSVKKVEVAPTYTIKTPSALTTSTWGVFDPRTGKILAGNNINTPLPIASVTKLFTATTVMKSEKRDSVFTIVASDVNTEGRAGKLVMGGTTTPYELLFPLLIESSNDAGVAIERVLGDDFDLHLSALKNEIPLVNSTIIEPTGLQAGNVSTVVDLALLYAYIQKTYPHILDITVLNTYIGTNTGYQNSDPARTLQNFSGGKNGYTDEANRTFVGTFTHSNSLDEIGVILLGSDDLLSDVTSILSSVDNDYESSDILKQ